MVAVLAALVAAGVAGVFATQLGRQYGTRRRPYALAWCAALALFCVGSLAVASGITFGWEPWIFAVYWLAGALLTVPFLAAGQLMLMDPGRAVLYWTLAGLATVWAVVAVALSPFDVAALRAASAADGIPVGADVFEGTLAHTLLRWVNYTAVVVVAGVVYSALTTRRWLILLIAVGVLVAGMSFVFVRGGQPALFSAALAAGVAMMYAGFRAAAKPR